MEAMTLSEIARAVGGALSPDCDGELKITNICTDSRKLEDGCLFIAIKGDRFDGHDFADAALEQGAAAVVVHDGKPRGKSVAVEDTRKALCDLARHYRSKFDIHLVGVTGSVGKTTTKEMIYAVLSSQFSTHKTSGNFNNDIGLPMTLFGLDGGHGAAVIEMGMSALGEIELLTGTALPTVGVITNIGVSHIENLGSRENILRAKLEILSGMSDDAPLLLNGDDDLLGSVELGRENVYYYGTSDKCRFRAENIAVNDTNDGMEFDISFDGRSVHVWLPAVGVHNVLDAAAAFGVGIVLGIEPERASRALSDYRTCGMRQKIVDVDGITVIEDCYNASPDSMRASLTTLSGMNVSRKIAVLGDMLELGERSRDFHCEVGRFAKGKADILYCYGCYAEQYIAGFEGAGEAALFKDKETLADELYRTVKKGDAVLFKASRGMHLEDVISSFYEKLEK